MAIWSSGANRDNLLASMFNRVVAAFHEEMVREQELSKTPEGRAILLKEDRAAKAREQARIRREEKKERDECQMWLDIYQPGTKYDPAIHFIPEPESRYDYWDD